MYAKSMYGKFAGMNEQDLKARRQRIINNRLYAQGNQPTQKYIDLLNLNGDTSYLNLNVSPLSIVAKFVDTVTGDLDNQDYEVQVRAIDPHAAKEREKARIDLLAKMKNQKAVNEFEQRNGVDLGIEPSTFDFEEEIDLHMEMNFKQSIEIALELGIEKVFNDSGVKEIRRQNIHDLITAGEAWQRAWLDPQRGPMVRWVDPENVIYNYSTMADLRDLQYAGEMKVMTISELRRISDLEESALQDIANMFAGRLNNPDEWSRDGTYNAYTGFWEYTYDSFSVTVLDFEFLSEDEEKYEKKFNKYGGSTFHKKPQEYTPPKKSKYKREQEKLKFENVYGGFWVVGSDYIFNYGLKSNMPRKNGDLTKTSLSFKGYITNFYRQNNKSLVERMIPHADQMMLAHLKIQQMVAKARPAGISVEIGGLQDAVETDGGTFMSPLELIEIFNQTGNQIWRRTGDDGEFANYGEPIKELKNGLDFAGLQALIATYNNELNMIRDVTGINEFRDGTKPSSETLVGVQKLSILASNNATRQINNGWISITSRIADSVCIGIQDVIRFSKFKMKFTDSIGKFNVKSIELLDGAKIHDFGIYIEVAPDEEEKAMLEANIQKSIDRGELRIEDAIMIRQVKNLKMANQLLVVRRKKYAKEKQEADMANIQAQAQANQQAAMAKAQADAQLEQMRAQGSVMKVQMEGKSKSEALMLEYKLKSELSRQEFQQEMVLEGKKSESQLQRDDLGEDRKDAREYIKKDINSPQRA